MGGPDLSTWCATTRSARSGIRYWEIGNEGDIGEDGGCPYHFTPENYLTYYQHTAAAILRADPGARVGGPAVANYRSALLPALLDFGNAGKAPVHFVSWHIYSSDPAAVRHTIEYVHELAREAAEPQGGDLPRRVEHVALASRAGSALPAGLRGRNGVADGGRGARLLLLLSHPRLLRGCSQLLAVHVRAGRSLHGTLVEPHAAVRRPFRLSGHGAPGLLRLQAAEPADGRQAEARFDGPHGARTVLVRSVVSDAQPAAGQLFRQARAPHDRRSGRSRQAVDAAGTAGRRPRPPTTRTRACGRWSR